MKNLIRLLFIAAIMLTISGCDAEYNMNIKSDLRVEEHIKILEDNSFLYGVCTNDLDACINNNISSVRDQGLIKGRYVKPIYQTSKSGADSLYVYDNFNAFQNSNILLNQFYKSMTMTTNGNLVTLYFDSIDAPYPPLNAVGDNNIDGSLLTNFTFNISVPYVVTSNNADKVDKINNIYTWNYDSSTLYKDVNLVFDESKAFHTDVTDVVKKDYKEGKLNNILIIGISAGTVLIIMAFFVIRNYRRNKV